jgi:hypothetical protein
LGRRLKGTRIGEWKSCQQHANFLLNDGSGTAEDYTPLDRTRTPDRFWRNLGVKLELEIEMIENGRINMSNKLRHCCDIGGRSGEHEVSLMSARSVLSVLNPEKYNVTQIGITHSRRLADRQNVIEALESTHLITSHPVVLMPEPARASLYRVKDKQT